MYMYATRARAHIIIIITITWTHLTSLNWSLDFESSCGSKSSMLNANCGELCLHLSLSTPRSTSFCQRDARLFYFRYFLPFNNLLPFLCLEVVKAFTVKHSVSQLLQRQRQRAGRLRLLVFIDTDQAVRFRVEVVFE